MGRWSWSTDAWDFDHDGYSGSVCRERLHFRSSRNEMSRVFSGDKSSRNLRKMRTLRPAYERGWSAMNELIRSDCDLEWPREKCFPREQSRRHVFRCFRRCRTGFS